MYRIPSTLKGDLDYTESLIKKYQTGGITAGELKSNRVPMGIYEQRKNHHYMLRIRCAGGLITPEQLAKVAQVGRQVSTSHLHITTRQEIQIHNVDIDDAVPALRKLEKVGLSSAGGGGNTVRNMMADDRSGLTDSEAFDVYPYVVELTSRLIAERDSFTMPRKYKVAFDYSEADARYSHVADLGLQAKVRDGERGFRVLIAGSTAPNPHTSWEVFDFLPEVDLLRAAKALKNWFNKYGNRRNRHKARMRYVFYRYGEDEARRLYLDEFAALKADATLDFHAPALPATLATPSFAPVDDCTEAFRTWKRRYAHAQRQAGLWYAYIPVPHGNGTPEFFAEVAEFLGAFGNDVIRFTKREQIQVRNIPEAYLPNIYQFFKSLGLRQIDDPVVITSLTSCTGADTCRLGICMPKGAVDAIRKQLLASDLDLDAIPDFELKMNGCANICANATWCHLGFSGRVGRVGDHPYPAYTVWLPYQGALEISYQQGYLPAKAVPAFVVDYLRDVIAERDHYADYYDYVRRRGAEVVKQLLSDKYKGVLTYEENPDTFFDWGDDEKFSLIKYGQAECSAGLFDIIDIDQDTIAEKRKLLATGEGDREKVLHDLVFAENRMLLVTRGIDPRTDDDVYDGFLAEFIDKGIVPERFRTLTLKARQGEALAGLQALAEELADLLNDLYKHMDDNLQFKLEGTPVADAAPAPAPAEPSVAEAAAVVEAPEAAAPDVRKDFRGVACPMNFVKTKIALAPMQSGQVLEILLDDGAPIANVPGSVRGEGHTVLATEKVDDYWRVTIKKK